MKINLRTFILLTITIATSFASCSKRDEPLLISITGEWTTIERRVTTGDDFLDQSINSLFILDDKDYTITRTFIQTTYNVGALETVATNKNTGNEDRKRDATYEINGDSIYIDDKKFEQTTSGLILGEKLLVTYTKVGKKELDHIIEEIGGDPNLIPNNITGILKMKETR
ncbi:MAG: hypothetical protein ACK5KT_00170 [Dysgonomonas sp.]